MMRHSPTLVDSFIICNLPIMYMGYAARKKSAAAPMPIVRQSVLISRFSTDHHILPCANPTWEQVTIISQVPGILGSQSFSVGVHCLKIRATSMILMTA